MNVTLIRIDAQDASGGAVPMRLASHDIPEACHLGGEEWEPALATLPDFALDFFGGAFAGQVTAPRTGFTVTARGLAGFSASPATRPRFADARVRIWIGDITSPAAADLGPLTLRFDGRITGEPDIDEASRIARFDAAVQDSWADKPLLGLFAGTDGIEGPADLTGQVKPLALGNARFCGGTLIDNVDNIWMVSAGPVQAINAVYDRLASLGPSAGNFASLAALKAASIPNGSWGTCLALGLVRLGAPPDGRVSFDVSGSNSGTGGYVRRPGAMIRRIADLASGTVNAASLSALNVARPYNLALQLREQVTARDVIAQLADSVGAVAGVSLRGELFAQGLAIGTPSDVLAADDSSALRVAAVEELAKAAPSWRLATEAELTFEVHSADEAAFNYRWQGEYAPTRVYRRDDVVSGADGASWAYINATPAAGQALPVWPTSSNSYWALFQAPAGASIAPANSNRVPLSRMEGDSGWETFFNPSGLSIASGYNAVDGFRYYDAIATATSAGQSFALRSQFFRVSSGERLSAQARFLIGGTAPGTWLAQLIAFDAANNPSFHFIAGGTGALGGFGNLRAEFVQLPAGAVTAYIQLIGTSAGAGTMQILISEPMVTSAAPGQTVHPPFSPGPVLTGPIDAGGPLLIGQLPTDKAAPGLQNALVPLGDSNRVPLSRMEGDRGWTVTFNSAALPIETSYESGPLGRRLFLASANTTAADQQIVIGNELRTAVRLNESERISLQARVFRQGTAAGTWSLEFWTFDASLSTLSADTIASGIGLADPVIKWEGFLTVPPGGAFGRFELRFIAAGAGSVQLGIAEPMVTGAAAGQTVHPAFTPGPNAVDGATRNTGALNADGLNAVDAGGPLLIGQLPTDKAAPGLQNALVPLGDSNRVPLSRMEGDSGYGVLFNPSGLSGPTDYNSLEGQRFFRVQAMATAAGQQISVGNAPATQPAFRLNPNERISVQARVEAQGAGAAGGSWTLALWGFLPDGTQSLTAVGSVSGSAPRAIGNGHVQFFADVPSNIVGGRLELYGNSGGAGLLQVVISEPMVTSAASGQTVHPPFTPGPNGVDGATRNTGALNADGLNAVDAGGPLLIGQLPPSKADPGLVNTNVPLGSNAVVNSEFTRGKFGWRAGNGALDSQWGVNLTGTPNWFGQRNVMWMTAPGAFAINSVRDLSPNALWEGGGLPNALQFAMPVVAGDRLAASVLGAQHRCTIQLYILIFDGAGTLISAPVVGGGTPGGAANGDPANFTRLTLFADAPANARWAIPMMRLLGTGESDPFIFFTEPMLAKVPAGQTTVPAYSPGRADPNADVTATVSGPAEITMQFRADLALLSPLPLTADYQLGVAGASPLTSGVSWSVAVVSGSFTGTAPSIVGSGTGQLRINSPLASPEATLRITASVAGRASPPFVVRVARNVAAPSLAPLTFINSGTFAQAHDTPIQITLPSSASSVSLTAVADLLVNAEAPQGGTTVEGKWQRETSPGTWADVGAAATSSPNPEVILNEPSPGEFFFTASPGSITCNRTATGLTTGSIQRFRFVARVSGGNVRTVAFVGNASANA